jgi:hypothetical protein
LLFILEEVDREDCWRERGAASATFGTIIIPFTLCSVCSRKHTKDKEHELMLQVPVHPLLVLASNAPKPAQVRIVCVSFPGAFFLSLCSSPTLHENPLYSHNFMTATRSAPGGVE